MSERIKSKMKKNDDNNKVVIISKVDFRYLNSIANIRHSVDYYLSQVQSEYLKILSLGLGYKIEDDLEFSIDLKDESRALTIHKFSAKEKAAVKAALAPKKD